MGAWGCWSLAGWPIIGRTLLSLHLLPLWAILAVIVSVLWMPVINALKISLKSMTTRLLRSKQKSQSWKWRGLARHEAAAATIVFALALVTAVAASYRSPGVPKVIELHNVKVLRDIGRYDYWFQTEDGKKFYSTFCADYEPQFSAGQTLVVLKYEDRGACWSVANTHPSYLILRDENGIPIVRR